MPPIKPWKEGYATMQKLHNSPKTTRFVKLNNKDPVTKRDCEILDLGHPGVRVHPNPAL